MNYSMLLAWILIAAPGMAAWKSTPITVYTQFQQEYSEITFQSMKAELALIMGPIGLQFEWRSLDPSRGSEPAAELVVVTLKGSCRMESFLPGIREAGPLGWTHVSDGEVLPFSELDCERIRRFIHPEIAGEEPEERDRVLGRAMGRVLAHELYHIFASTTRHGSVGLAKAVYSAAELASDNFQFEEKEAILLRQGKLRSLLANPGAPHAGGGQ